MTADEFHDFTVKFCRDVETIATKYAILEATEEASRLLATRPDLKRRVDARRAFPRRPGR